jgi:hypothetical protein
VDDLRARIAEALRETAYSCDGSDCGQTEQECEDRHPVRRPEPWRFRVRLEGSPEGLADAVLAVVQPELDRLASELEENTGVMRALRRQRDEAERQRDRFRLAWQSARRRARKARGLAEPERCCVCSSAEVGYHNYRDQPFCWPCADGDRPNTTTEETLP